jgi:hypothetical protein
MRDWSSLQKSYLRLSIPKRLGELAASLANVQSFSKYTELQSDVERIIETCEQFINWTAHETEPSVESELLQLRQQLTEWRQNWTTIWNDSEQLSEIAKDARDWSDRIIGWSGLLQATPDAVV